MPGLGAVCKGPAARRLQCLWTGERSARSQTELRTHAEGEAGTVRVAGVPPSRVRCPRPPGFLPREPRACSGLPGAHSAALRAMGASSCRG